MKSTILAALVSAITAVGVSVSQAQVSIRDLQRNPGISISGEIRSVVGNEFILDDGTGQVIVDAGPRWYHQLNFTPGEHVTVVGEYDDEDFDAYTITRDGGEVVQIREAGEPPPWADGRGRRDR
ncbi:MAG: DNA-binding protein [Oscillatoriales cyanobacterium RM1_1_9]|nr:DNA-binding protein [bacterium]NJO52919.1 DNA-binding protein [Leptolyngbyaceae cyanobacterium RM2_2_4]NJO71496.1 DNA-binding protein [Oscillatoriales cyanobacterium RM1_1_9]